MMMANTVERKYEDFDPVSDLLSEKECDTLLLYLPGFRKEQLKVQLTTSRILRISGERPTGDNKWKRFNKEVHVTSNVDMKEMTAKFEGGILYIRQPKLITPAEPAATAAPAEPAAPAEQLQDQQGPTGGNMEKKEEGEMDRKEKDEISAESNEERKGKWWMNELREQVGVRIQLFKELSKPEKLRRLAVYVVLLLILVFQITKMFKSFTKVEEQTVLEFNHQEF
ncbi:hypothetical protein SOVF_066380 [Spinacia oleracea]|uniref:Inactive protein RESTRICTED TEV MOVEMENT 2 n=1 Tax=Spinacia oleracea TaxID=3562 RepID=A0A9R0JJD2_SPIOL|nr:inactive protein RESTRICTED TEV MOVEMENT 2-like [Spinacia oleracea]KNA18911.1 hypothetical protein SOVF_066380 [Spinacia oleracea]